MSGAFFDPTIDWTWKPDTSEAGLPPVVYEARDSVVEVIVYRDAKSKVKVRRDTLRVAVECDTSVAYARLLNWNVAKEELREAKANEFGWWSRIGLVGIGVLLGSATGLIGNLGPILSLFKGKS